jgi:hypothetical protein
VRKVATFRTGLNFQSSEFSTTWWLDQKMPYPPERMDEIFRALVTPTFRTMLE